MKKWLLFLAKLVLTGLCLWWALREVDWQNSILSSPSELSWGWIAGGVFLAGVTVLLTAVRLWVLLWAQGIRITLWRAVELTLIGNLFNLLAVGSIGSDAARIFLLIRDHPERKMAVTLTVMFDHLVGLVAMSLVFFVLTAGRFDALASQSDQTKAILHFAWIFFSGGLIGIALMFVLSAPLIHDRIKGKLMGTRFAGLRHFPEALDVYRRKWGFAVIATIAAIVMLPVYYASFWCGARAAGSMVEAAPILVAMPVVDMLSAMPLSISGLGVREVSMKILMEDLTGMKADVAVAASLIGFVCMLVWSLLGGLLFLRPKDRASVEVMETVTAEDDSNEEVER
jgi:uncharacterized membrane protein YbhN (UPF0104 family)